MNPVKSLNIAFADLGRASLNLTFITPRPFEEALALAIKETERALGLPSGDSILGTSPDGCVVLAPVAEDWAAWISVGR